ncbi:arginine--tRNA ligase [Candidatus Kaiserbacteria bacterium]|nr:arginine--tRNA ligase [Candidatus Kaiserbacteria bacterium]
MEERIRKAVGSDATIRRPLPAFGDYSVYGGERAKEIAGAIREKLGNAVQKVEIVKGFVNITLAPEAVAFAVAEADAQDTEWGKFDVNAGKKISVEYGNPNPFKEIHIGHLMSNIIGESVSRLIEASGAVVVRDTFGGDVGPHVAKALWALRKDKVAEITNVKQIGEAYARGSNVYSEDETAKQEIDTLNARIYELVAHPEKAETEEERALLKLWQHGREISMEEFRRIFAKLGTRFDYEFFDSDTTEPGLRVVRDGLAKGIFEESDGAIIYRGEKKGLHTLVFITGRGTPTYETKDIGLAFIKEERIPSDEAIIVTGAEQKGHFAVFLAALSEIAPRVAEKTKHVAHGLLSLTSGKMSSRLGNVITATGLIEDVIAKASEKNPDPLIAEQVAVGAIKYMVLRQAPGSDIIFDAEKSLSLEGDSGPYLQYALVRAKKILAYGENGEGGTDKPPAPYAIERLIVHYPEVVARAAHSLAPNLLVNYLTELASAWNAFYATEQVLGSPEEAYKQRVTRAFAHTMTNGLHLLGIPTPSKM